MPDDVPREAAWFAFHDALPAWPPLGSRRRDQVPGRRVSTSPTRCGHRADQAVGVIPGDNDRPTGLTVQIAAGHPTTAVPTSTPHEPLAYSPLPLSAGVPGATKAGREVLPRQTEAVSRARPRRPRGVSRNIQGPSEADSGSARESIRSQVVLSPYSSSPMRPACLQ